VRGFHRRDLAQVAAVHPAQIAVGQAHKRPRLALLQYLHRRSGQHLALLLAEPRRAALQAGHVGGDGQQRGVRRAQNARTLPLPTRVGHAAAQMSDNGPQCGLVQHAPLQAVAAITGGDLQFGKVKAVVGERLLRLRQRTQ